LGYFGANFPFSRDAKLNSDRTGKDLAARNLSAAHPKTNLMVRQVFGLKLGPSVVTSVIRLVRSASRRYVDYECRSTRMLRQQHAMDPNSGQIRAYVSFDQLLKSLRRERDRGTINAGRDPWFGLLIFVDSEK
jgi:hypothetical protein